MNTLPPNSLIDGRYRIKRVLGQGGMGVVYAAADEKMGHRKVALKMIGPGLQLNEELLARFKDEAMAAAMLKSPHVVSVHEFGSDKGMPYIVMELLEGRDLQQLMEESGPLEIAVAVNIILDVCRAIAAAHAFQVSHRDLTPRNVFVTKEWAKVLDFGTSRMPGTPRRTEQGSLVVTWQYACPERLKGEEGGTLGDLYSIGVLLYEAVTGSVPFISLTRKEPLVDEALQLAIVSGSFVDPLQLKPDLPGEMVTIIRRSMARQPMDRFPSVHLLGRALLPFAGERGLALHRDYFSGPEPMVQRSEILTGPVASGAPPVAHGRVEEITVQGEFAAVEEFKKSRALEGEATVQKRYARRKPSASAVEGDEPEVSPSENTADAPADVNSPRMVDVRKGRLIRRLFLSLGLVGVLGVGAWMLGRAKSRHEFAAATEMAARAARPSTMLPVSVQDATAARSPAAEEPNRQFVPLARPGSAESQQPADAAPGFDSVAPAHPPSQREFQAQPKTDDPRPNQRFRSTARRPAQPKAVPPKKLKPSKRDTDDNSDILLEPSAR
jgi:serine/threonine protein kinase